MREGEWQLVNLSNGPEVAIMLRNLHGISFRSTQDLPECAVEPSVRNLWGLI
jgi:hypothetical protein